MLDKMFSCCARCLCRPSDLKVPIDVTRGPKQSLPHNGQLKIPKTKHNGYTIPSVVHNLLASSLIC